MNAHVTGIASVNNVLVVTVTAMKMKPATLPQTILTQTCQNYFGMQMTFQTGINHDKTD